MKQIVFLTGAIGVGKTTQAKRFEKNYNHIMVMEEFEIDNKLTKGIIKNTYHKDKFINEEVIQMYTNAQRMLNFQITFSEFLNNNDKKYLICDRGPIDPLVFGRCLQKQRQLFNDYDDVENLSFKLLSQILKNHRIILIELFFSEPQNNFNRILTRGRDNEDINDVTKLIVNNWNENLVSILKVLKNLNLEIIHKQIDVTNHNIETLNDAIFNIIVENSDEEE